MKIFGYKIETFVLALISIIAFCGFYYIASLSPGVEGGMDSYNHYLISRFSWVHPKELLLDQWGKPLYNILASPFAQFGMMGVIVFNILLLIGSSWLVYFTAKQLHFKFAWFGFILCLTSPIWFDNTITVLTEPLSAFLLILVVYLFAKEHILTAAILAGFLPFARSEGYVIIAVIGFYLFFVLKNYRAFLLLLAGSVFMNFVGWMVEGNPLWIYDTNPYIKYQIESTLKKENICGSGTLLHYVKQLPYVMGKTRLALFFAGTLMVVVRFIQQPKLKSNRILFFLGLGIYGLYFFVHTIIWYKGAMGSCGYARVLVVIEPVAALVMLFAAEVILNWFLKIFRGTKQRIIWLMILLVTGYMVYEPIKIYGHKYPIDISDEQKLFVETAAWFNEQPYEDRMKYFLYPYFNILTDIDPKDTEHFIEMWSFDIRYAPVGSIVIWDGHFGPNEGNVPLELLQNHTDFVEIKSFYPDKAFKTLNDYNFEIHVFERTGSSLLE
ncbi:MAG: hypothetical protein ACI9JN_002258 [Bacteroidia bacterium]|jgi:hypothetical protein